MAKKTYLDLSINEKIKLKSRCNLPLAYFFINGQLKRTITVFSDSWVGGKDYKKKIASPMLETGKRGMSKFGEDWYRIYQNLCKYGNVFAHK